MNLELHPLCTLFPRVTGREFTELVADIKANGLREPITTKNGMVLDGGNRYAACVEAGVEPQVVEYDGGDIVAFVLSKNLHRRHMTEGQRAAIVASAQNWSNAHKQGRQPKPARVPVSGDTDQPERAPLDSQADRAAAANVSERTQRKADKVAKASPEIAAEVARGEKTLNQAVREIEPHKPVAKPEPAAADPRIAELEAQVAELASNLESAVADIESLSRVADANDKVAAALAEAKRYREQARVIEERNRGLMNEKNAALSQAKSWMRKCQAAEKKLKEAEAGVEF